MRNAGLDELQAGIKIGGRNINKLRYADDTTLMTESKEELKSFLMRAKEETERASLKLNIKKKNILRPWHRPHHFMANRRGTGGSGHRAPLLGLRITADGDGSHGIRRRMLLGRKAMTNPDSVLKSRDTTLSTKVHVVKASVFSVVMYGCESWTIKKAEHQRTDAFELWCWRRLLRVPWRARSNQSILREINPEYSLEGLMLKLKLQYFDHLMRTDDSLEKSLMLKKIEGRRR